MPAKTKTPAKPKQRRAPRTFGAVEQLPSGRYRARYWGPDGMQHSAKTAAGKALTFETRGDADGWLAREKTSIAAGTWRQPGAPDPATTEAVLTLREYATDWLATRRGPRGQDLAVRTREHYDYLLRVHVLPRFGDAPLSAITPAAVRAWNARPGAKPTARAHSYALLRSILATAVEDQAVSANPCTVRGGGQASTAKKVRPLIPRELAALVAALPPRYRVLALLGCWCSLRFGELAGLQRADVDLDAGLLFVRRGVVRTRAGLISKAPKSEAGRRSVTIPPHILDDLRDHLHEHSAPGRDGWVFPGRDGGPLAASTLQRVFGPAAEKAGRPDVTPHVLRHSGQTLAALAGANLRELMARAGQSSPAAALRYLHEAEGRQKEIADKLTLLATATNVTPIQAAPTKRKTRQSTG